MSQQINDARRFGVRSTMGRTWLSPEGGAQSVAGMDGNAPLGAGDQRDLLNSAELVLIDLDGCLAFGNEPHPAASAFLARHDRRYAILSNNSSETPDGLAHVLARNGLKVDPRRILLAGCVMIDRLTSEPPDRRITLLASEAIHNYARERGLLLSPVASDVVALARDTTLSYDKLSLAIASLCRGAELVVSNPDLTHPGTDRLPVLETGAILRMLQACIADLAFTVVGKPSRTIFDIALARFGGHAANTVMIGDNPETDGAGARGAGIVPILVGPGQTHSSIAALL